METKFKLPTKILSTFLAVLMAVSCFSIAMPNLATKANAAATSVDYKNLATAFEAASTDGQIASGSYDVSTEEDGTVLIKDNTSDGKIYALADALFTVISKEGKDASFNHNTLIRDRIETTYKKNNDSYPDNLSDLVEICLPVDGNYAYTKDAPLAGTTVSAKAGDPETQFTSQMKSVIKVQRSVKSIVLTYDLDDVPGEVETTVVLTTTADPQSEITTAKDKAGLEWKTRKEWYTNSSVEVTYEKEASPDFSVLKSFVTYTKSKSFAPYYEQYLKDEDNIYMFEESYANNFDDNFKKNYFEKISVLDDEYVDKYLATEDESSGLKNLTAYNSFSEKIKSKYEVIFNRQYVEWAMNGASIAEAVDRDYYKEGTDKETLTKLIAQAQEYEDILNGTYNNIYTEKYGYVNGTIESIIRDAMNAKQVLEAGDVAKSIIYRMKTDENTYYNDTTTLFGLKNYQSNKYTAGNVLITDDELDAAIDWVETQLETFEKTDTDGNNVYDEAGKDAVVKAASEALAKEYPGIDFSDVTTYADLETFLTNLKTERASTTRSETTSANENYFGYFNKFIKESDSLDTAYLTDAYDTELQAKFDESKTAYNAAVKNLGNPIAERIYGKDSYRQSLVNSAKAAILSTLKARVDAQCKHMVDCAGTGVTTTNFSLVKAQKNTIDNKIITINEGTDNETTVSLYTWLGDKVSSGAKANYSKYASGYENTINTIMAKKFDGHKKYELSTNGVYTVRHALNHDMVRYVAGDGATEERYSYTVDKNKVNAVITKLDTFLTSESFTQLLGVDGVSEYSGKNITNLSEYIEDILVSNIFNDKLVNTLVSALFPMITKTLTELLTTKLDTLLGDLCTKPSDTKADAAIDVQKLGKLFTVDNLTLHSGTINLYLNGNHPDGQEATNTFVTVFQGIGLYVHPVSLAAKLEATGNKSTYSTFIADLKKANDDWTWFDKVANGGNGDGEVDSKDFIINSNGKAVLDAKGREQAKYSWGVKDYNTFVTALGDIFTSCLDLLRAVFTNYTFTTSDMTNLIRASGNAKLSYSILKNKDVKVVAINSQTKITINGMSGYQNLWAPIFEALGINTNTSGYSVSDLSVNSGKALSTTFGTSKNNAKPQEFVNALFNPLMILIDKLADSPIATITGILPNVAYCIAYNMVTPLINSLKLNLNLKLGLHFDDAQIKVIGITFDLGNILNKYVTDKENSPLIDQDVNLNLGETLNLNKMLADAGIDITDLNSIANKVVSSLSSSDNNEKKIDIPGINSGKLGLLGTVKTYNSVRTANQNSSLADGKYYYVEADKADVLYDLLSWLLNFVSTEGNLSGLMATLGQSGLGDEIESILGAVDANGALAALVELFLPRGVSGSGSTTGYDFANYNWYQNTQSTDSWTTSPTAEFVYTKYANYWTKAKAEYTYNNLETVANDVIKQYAPDLFLKEDGTYYAGINEWLGSVINNMFDNEGIHNVTKLFSKIGSAVAGNQTIVDLVKEQLNGGKGIDLTTWYNSFGYLDYDYTAYNKAYTTYNSISADETDETKIAERNAAFETISTAPLYPGETRTYTDLEGNSVTKTYNSDFNKLTVVVKRGESVLNATEIGKYTQTDEGTKELTWSWTYDGKTLVDNGTAEARELFTQMFTYLFTPAALVTNLLLTGDDLTLFNNALVIKGYDTYSNAIIPLLEMLGITELPTSAEFKAMEAKETMSGFNKLVDSLFDYVTYLLSDDGGTTVQKVINLLPRLFYFIQSDGITTFLKNALQPVWVLVDTLRPIADVDLDGFVHQFLCDYLGLAYDKTAKDYEVGPVVELVMSLINGNKAEKSYTAAEIAEDKTMVDAIYKLSVENLSLTEIIKVVDYMFGIDLTPAVYAFEGMCISYTEDGVKYGVTGFNSKRGTTDYTLNYKGADTVTVTLSVLLDLLRYGENAKGIDKLLGFVKEETGREGSEVTAAGLLQCVEILIKGKSDEEKNKYKQPNWDYLFEGKEVKLTNGTSTAWVDITDDDNGSKFNGAVANLDMSALSEYHSIYNLKYETDWTEDTAEKSADMLSEILDYVATMLDKTDGTKATSFEDFIVDLLNDKVLNGEILKSLADLIAKLYNALPASACELLSVVLSTNPQYDAEGNIIDSSLDVNFNDWKNSGYVIFDYELTEKKDADGNVINDADGNPIMEKSEKQTWQANPEYAAWADPESESYVKGKDEFIAEMHNLLNSAAPIFAWLFLQEDIDIFYTYGEGVNKKDYGKDAIVLDGLGVYNKLLVPVLEAHGYNNLDSFEFVDGSINDVTPGSYQSVDADGKLVVDSARFTKDIVEIVSKIVSDIVNDPINWVLDRLPGIVYFVNANGFTTIVENVFSNLKEVLDIVNSVLDEDSQINLAFLAKIINNAVGSETTDVTGELNDKFQLDFDTIIALIKKFTGIVIKPELVSYMKSLYIGKIVPFTSANGYQSFTMTYSLDEDKGDMVTILIALLLEIIEDKGTDSDGNAYDNPAAIDALIAGDTGENTGMVSKIVNALRNPTDVVIKDMDWDYFDKDITVAEDTETGTKKVTIPAYEYIYLNYTTNWTQDKSKTVAENLDELVLAVVKMVGGDDYKDYTDVGEAVKQLLNLNNFYTADNLNKILDLLSSNLYGENAVIPTAISNFAGALLGADLTQWNYTYKFESTAADGATYVEDTESGLKYRQDKITTSRLARDENGEVIKDADGNDTYETTDGKIYLVTDRQSFINAVTLMVKPAYSLIGWLMFGEDYTFFNAEDIARNDDGTPKLDALGEKYHEVLVKLPGSEGYANALGLLMEALGCVGGDVQLKGASTYLVDANNNTHDIQRFFNDILTVFCNRIDQIIEDPVDEITGMIPELLYFINAGGIGVVVQNLLSGVIGLLNAVGEINGTSLNINDLVTNILQDVKIGGKTVLKGMTFDIDAINLKYIISIVESVTGLLINDAVGTDLSKFYMGDLEAYNSVSGKLAYRVKFSEDSYNVINPNEGGNGQLSDFITILLSLVIDVLEYKQNAATVVELANINISVEIIEAVVDFLHSNLTVENKPFDWFYFDDTYTLYETDADGKLVVKDPAPETPGTDAETLAKFTNSINYLTYASDWTEETSEYIYQNRNTIISDVLKLANADETDLGKIVSDAVNLNEMIYTADNLNKILDLVQPLLSSVDDSLLSLLNIVLDIDLSELKNMEHFKAEDINGDRTKFVSALTNMLEPAFPILDWLLFGKDIQYFDKKQSDGTIEALISIGGANGYENGLVPLLEALGVTLPNIKEGATTKDVFYVLVNNVLSRAEGILANPVDEVIALLPELLYFINANGLATCVNNLLAGPVALLEKINPALGENAIDLDTLLNKVIEGADMEIDLDLDKLDLLSIATIVEQATGVELTDIFTENKIDKFFFGQMVYYDSAAAGAHFKMSYSSEQGPADMLTFIVNLAIEVLMYKDEANGKDNAKAIDILISGKDPNTGEPLNETVTSIVDILKGLKDASEVTADMNWNYFDETVDLAENEITVPSNAFVYLNYSNDWTYKKANDIDASIEGLVLDIINMNKSDDEKVSSFADFLKDIQLDSFLTAENLNKIYDMIAGLIGGDDAAIPASLLTLAGMVLNADLTTFNYQYHFEAKQEGIVYLTDSPTGLLYRVDTFTANDSEHTGKIYAIDSSDDFAKGLSLVISPAEQLLGWLLLGNSFGFFVSSADGNVDADGVRQTGELIRFAGSDGYGNGLALLLEALGCEGLKKSSEYKNCGELIEDVISSVLARADEILKNPVEEITALIPELLYFINAGGLNVVVTKLAAPVINALDKVEPLTGKKVDIDTLLTDVLKNVLGDKAPEDFTFTLAGVNLQWVIDFAELFTGIEISDAIGYGLEKFALGVVKEYNTASNYEHAYKMVYSEDDNGDDNARDRADLITIILSLVLDVLEYDPQGDYTYPNADAIAKLINSDSVSADMIKGIITIINGYGVSGTKPIDWFYFDSEKSAYNEDGTVKDPAPTYDENSVTGVPENTINYLTYASDWNRETAEYLDNNLEAIIGEVLNLTGKSGTNVAEIIADTFSVSDLYTADNLNAIVNAVTGLTGKVSGSIIKVAGIVLGADLTAYDTMTFTDEQIVDKATFVNGLVQVLTPLTPLLDWLLFGDDIAYFSAKDHPDQDVSKVPAKDLIKLSGYNGYASGLVPILEALGITLPDCTTVESSSEILGDVVTAALDRVEGILANPVDEVLGLLPNILYFINANGISASVQNLLGAGLSLVDAVNNSGLLGKNDDGTFKTIDLNAIINDALAGLEINGNKVNVTIDINNLDLLAIVKIIEGITGLNITDIVAADKLDNFRVGQISYFKSSNGQAAFKMSYSDTQGRIDMLTILINFVLEVIMDENNAAAIEKLMNLEDGTVVKIVNVLGGTDVQFNAKTFNWNYFDKNVTLGENITVPAYSFVYLNYANDWTYDKAAYLDSGLKDLVNGIIKMTAKDGDPVTVEELIAKNVDLNELVFKPETLNSLLNTVSGLFYGENAVIGQHLGEVAGLILGGELAQWNGNYSFEAYDESNAYNEGDASGLLYRVEDGKAIFAIEDAEDFIAGLIKILNPLEKLLSWLLLGDSYEFFVANTINTDSTQDTIIKIGGQNGYKNGLVYLLEALGVEGLKSDYADASALLKDVLTGLVKRVEGILANPIDEVLALIPELIYFINANGLGVTVYNMLGSVINIYDAIAGAGLLDSIEAVKDYNNGTELANGLLTKVLQDLEINGEKAFADVTFDIDNINLGWAIDLVEKATGLDLTTNINSLSTFAIGEVYKYDSASGKDAYKMRFAETGNGTDKARDRADMITIVLSYLIDLLGIEQNQTKIEELVGLNSGTIASVLALLKDYEIKIDAKINWFYFDDTVTVETIDATTDLKSFTPSINYLTYASMWTENIADYLDTNLNDVIATVLEMVASDSDKGKTVAELVKGMFNPETQLYTGEMLQKIADAVVNLTSKIDANVLNTIGLVLDVDLAAYSKMDFGTGKIGKDDFIDGICEIIKPLSGVLDWLLFGDDYGFFSNDKTKVQNLIVINGYQGYAYGLVPLLEALGVKVPTVTADANTDNTVNGLVTAIVDRMNEILADPVEEALALIPNILYFINANGLAAAVNHLLGAALGLVNKVNEEKLITKLGLSLDLNGDGVNDETIDLNGLVNKLLKDNNINVTIDISNITLITIIKVVEALTGLDLETFVKENGIENFYLGQITYFESANGSAAFKMEYVSGAEAKSRGDLITVVVNYLIEAVLYGDNATVIDKLISGTNEDGTPKKDTVSEIIELLEKLGGETEDKNAVPFNWNYFDKNVTLSEDITVPAYSFVYLNYANDWTYDKAAYLDSGLKDLVNGIIKMTAKDGDPVTVEELIAKNVDLNELVFKPETLNSLLNTVSGLFYGENAVIGQHLGEVAGLILGGELAQWNGNYSFEAYDESNAYNEGDASGLLYRVEDGKAIFAIEDAEDFIAGLIKILNPLEKLLSWLLLGDSYEFFVANTINTDSTQDTIIKIGGQNGYKNGLVYLLEALGVEGLKSDYADASALLKDVLTGLVKRVEGILANPIDEVLALIPELIYFINANGLGVTVYNMLGSVINIYDAIAGAGLLDSIEAVKDYNNGTELANGLLTKVLQDLEINGEKAFADVTFDIDNINLGWAIDLVEKATGLDLTTNINSLSTFAIGEVYKYDSASGKDAYKMRFAETGNGTDKARDRADMITIVLSYLIDLLGIEQNQTKIEELVGLNSGTIASVLALLKDYEIKIDAKINWFYFDDTVTVETIDATTDLKSFTPSINYLTYASMWTENIADYLDTNLNDVIATVLEMVASDSDKGKTVAELVKGMFNPETQLYTGEMLQKIADAVVNLTSKIDANVLNTIGLVLDVDLAAYSKMDFGTGKIGKDDFIDGICEIIKPLSGVLDWLLFGDDYGFFSNDKTKVQNLIVINGYQGYAYGLVPLLEALGVKVPTVTADANTDNTVNGLVTAIVDRMNEILADPVEEALALIPNILYFINANGLAAAVNHLLGAALGLVNKVNEEKLITKLGLSLDLNGDGVNDETIDLNGLVNKLLKDNNINVTIDISNITLITIIKVVEALTGLDLETFVKENGIENFYLGQITYFESANGSAAFKMEYVSGAEAKSRGDLITVVVNYLIEAVLYGDNATVIDKLISGTNEDGTPKKQTVAAIINMLEKLGTESLPGDFHWNYMNEDGDNATPATEYDLITLPATPFNNHLTYCTDWTQKTADYLYENLGTLVDTIIKMTGKGEKLTDLIGDMGSKIYTADNLNKILDLTKKLYDLADKKVINLIGLVLSCDLSSWESMHFEASEITDSASFAAGLIQIVKPIYPLLNWLLFGSTYGFFVSDKYTEATGTQETLINIAGADGYINGIAPLLIALGVELPEYSDGYKCATPVKVNGIETDFFSAVINSVVTRVNDVLANPVNEALDLLPGLLYFINANGVSTAAYNLLGGVLNAVNVLVEEGVISLDGGSIEEYVENTLGLNVKNLDLEGIITFLENKEYTKGIKINDVFKGTYEVSEDGTVKFTANAEGGDNILEKFYCGDVVSYTYGGKNGWKMVTKDGEGKGDMITTLLSIVLDVLFYDGNEDAIAELIGSFVDGFTVENFQILKALLTTGVDLEGALKDIDWVYFNEYATDEERTAAIKAVLLDPASNVLPSTKPERTTHYLEYDNNWNADTANYIDANINEIADLVITKFTDYTSLNDILDKEVKSKLYTADTVNWLLGKISGALEKLDDSLIDVIGVALDVDLKALCKTVEANEVTDKASFVAVLSNRLANIGNVLDWILFNQQMTFFTDLATGADAMITLNGGEGYKYGLAPILGALGVDTFVSVPEKAAENSSITAAVLPELLTNVCDRIDEILANPIDEVLALLPELIYFINADGVVVSAQNLVAPIDVLLSTVGEQIGKDDLTFSSLIKFDLGSLNFKEGGILNLVKDKTGIDVYSPIGEYLQKFYFGKLESYTTYGDVGGFKMVYSDEDTRIDFVTVLLTLVLDVATYNDNKAAIIKLLGDNDKANNIYNTVMAFMGGAGDYHEVPVAMKTFDWIFKDKAGTGEVLSPMVTGSIYSYVYGPLYTREMGEYITKYLPLFIDTMITLLGVEIKGVNLKSLEDLIKSLVGESIYTTDLLNKLLSLIQGLVPKLKELLGDELFKHLATIVNDSIGVDLTYWDNYKVNSINTGDQTAFVNELVRMLRPAYPILKWLLCDENLAFFNTQVGDDYIVIESARGYAYGIIPILEALNCTGIMSEEAYIAAADANADNILTNILNPLLTKVNAIFANPVDEILAILPPVIYFLNSEGLDVVVRNTLNAVAKVLETVEPTVGKDLDLATLFGFDFDVDIEGLLDQALKSIEEKYGFKLAVVATEAVKELTVGTVEKFDSLSGQAQDGEQAYTMKYASGSSDKVDMVTIILRLVLRFISDPQNVKAIEALLVDNLSEEGYKFLCSLLENFSQMCGTTDGMDKIMYTVYYIFYSANVAAHSTKNFLAEFNGNYSFLNQLFATSDLAFMRQIEKSLGDLLNNYTGDIVDDDEVAPKGFVKFFQSLKDFFQKILNFFKKLFGGK